MLTETESTVKALSGLKYFNQLKNKSVWVINSPEKKPIQFNGKSAKSNDPETWTTFANIEPKCNEAEGNFPAVALVKETNLIFIDLDNALDPVTGKPLYMWIADLLKGFDNHWNEK